MRIRKQFNIKKKNYESCHPVLQQMVKNGKTGLKFKNENKESVRDFANFVINFKVNEI
jgi:hypothetical protein